MIDTPKTDVETDVIDARIFKISFFGPKNFEKIFRQRLTHFRGCEHTQNVSIFDDPLYVCHIP